MISIFVSIQVKSGLRDKFIDAALDDAKGSVRDEVGCFRFDILKDDDNPDLVHFYEVYADQSALEAHRQMPHYLKWRETVLPWFDGEPRRISTTTVFPSDAGWKTQKPSLVTW